MVTIGIKAEKAIAKKCVLSSQKGNNINVP